jgi:short-subunit dehydrogenase
LVAGVASLEINEMNAPDKSWVLITGASSGFGEEFARQYAAQGHSLVLVARRLDRLRALAEALRQQFHTEVVVEQVDLSDIEAVLQLHQRLGERGIEIDILINNAGHGLQGLSDRNDTPTLVTVRRHSAASRKDRVRIRNAPLAKTVRTS